MAWAKIFQEAVGVDPKNLKKVLEIPLCICTACSGSGAPSYALDELIGRRNFVEVAASEKHVARVYLASFQFSLNIQLCERERSSAEALT